MNVKWTLVGLLACCAAPGLAQDKDELRAEIDALRQENMRLQDELITKERMLDKTRRQADERLEQAQRKVQELVRDGKLKEARLNMALRRSEQALAEAHALLKKHGIELPGPEPVAKRVESMQISLNVELGATVEQAVEQLRVLTKLSFRVEKAAAGAEVSPLRIKEISVKNALTLLLETAPKPLAWRIEGDTVVIGPKPPPK